MNLGRIFANAVARRIAFVLVAMLFAWLGLGEARAQTTKDCQAVGSTCNRQEAYAQAVSLANAQGPATCKMIGGASAVYNGPNVTVRVSDRTYMAGIKCTPGGNSSNVGHTYWVEECPPGRVWNDELKQCKKECAFGDVEDPLTGECKSCLQYNGRANGFPYEESSRPWSERCLNGCQFSAAPGTRLTCITVGTVGSMGSQKICSGIFQFTGNTCTVPPNQPPPPEPPEKPKPQECIPVAGQTVCIKPDGQHCSTTTPDRSICWRPGETGEKSDGHIQQQRQPGQDEGPPNKPLPNGEEGQKQGQTIIQRTEVTINGETRTIITATTNYATQTGTDANPSQPPQGQPSDGSGGPQGPGAPGGEDGDDKNTSSGGGDCDTPPSSSGDPILAQIATQAWFTRCATEGKAGGDAGCDAPPPPCSGNNILCRMREEQRTRHCADEAAARADREGLEAIANGPDGLEGVSEDSIFGDPAGANLSQSESRYGGGMTSCSLGITLGGQAFELPPQFFDAAAFIRWLVVLSAYLSAAIWIARR